MGFQDILDVTVSLQAATVAGANFGVAMILGSSGRFANDTGRIYSSLQGMADDGFLTSDPEYRAARALLSQENVPPFFLVGQMGSEVAQVDTVTINTATAGHVVTDTINGTAFTYTVQGGDSTADIATAVAALIQAGASTTGVGAAATSTHYTLTATAPGVSFTNVLSGNGAADVSLVHTTPNYGVQEALTRIEAAGASWYETILISRASKDILNLARWTEPTGAGSMSHIAMVQTSESSTASTLVDPSGTDVGNVLHHLGFRRTAGWWHALDSEYLEAGISGRELPLDPGTDNWAMKKVAGISPNSLSETQKSNLFGPPGQPGGKYMNTYYPLLSGGQNPITMRGTMADGTWIDAVRFVDFLKNRVQVAIANLFLTVEKVGESELGIQQVVAQITGVLQAAKDSGAVNAFAVTAPAISSISPTDRSARRMIPGTTFSAELSGAFNYAQVRGTVTE